MYSDILFEAFTLPLHYFSPGFLPFFFLFFFLVLQIRLLALVSSWVKRYAMIDRIGKSFSFSYREKDFWLWIRRSLVWRWMGKFSGISTW